ncbi:MAG: hypothetical protein IH874_03190 [Candidatus Dadabacteria bacterium]|nr:hypothetical protein [Candidatus Dadabacteria bacterium]
MLKSLISSLAKRQSTDCVFNPYRQGFIRNNVRVYFDYLLRTRPEVMLVGEAPGWRGACLTGIPFTSGQVLNTSPHQMLRAINAEIELREEMGEFTARAVWEYLGVDKPAPLMWNAFPFHPHKVHERRSNRRPTQDEIREGFGFIEILYELLKPSALIALGRVAEAALKEIYPNKTVHYVRHPARGGARKFSAEMNRALSRTEQESLRHC